MLENKRWQIIGL